MDEDRRYQDAAVTLKPLLQSMLKSSKKVTKKRSAIELEWEQVMPAGIRQYTRLVSFKRQILTVAVPTSAILAELVQTRQAAVSALNESQRVHVRDIKYVVG